MTSLLRIGERSTFPLPMLPLPGHLRSPSQNLKLRKELQPWFPYLKLKRVSKQAYFDTLITNKSHFAVAVMSSPPQASTSKTIKTYTKESLQEIPNITITKRYNLSVCEDSASGSHRCIECKDPLRKKNHFSGYYSCMSCRFSTSCGIAMRAHQNQAHKPPWTPLLGELESCYTLCTLVYSLMIIIGSVFALDRLVRCQCGFTSQGGIEVSRHMKKCGTSSVTVLS